jgi:hypothetical protein
MHHWTSAAPTGGEYVTKEQFIKQLNATVHGGGGGPGLGDSDLATGTGTDPARARRQRQRRHRGRVLGGAGGSGTIGGGGADSGGGSGGDSLLKRALALYPPRESGAVHHPLGNNAELVGWFESDQFMCNARREVLAASKAVSAGGAAFLYQFDWWFQSDKRCSADSNWHTPLSGSNHCDEMTFVFGQPIFGECALFEALIRISTDGWRAALPAGCGAENNTRSADSAANFVRAAVRVQLVLGLGHLDPLVLHTLAMSYACCGAALHAQTTKTRRATATPTAPTPALFTTTQSAAWAARSTSERPGSHWPWASSGRTSRSTERPRPTARGLRLRPVRRGTST